MHELHLAWGGAPVMNHTFLIHSHSSSHLIWIRYKAHLTCFMPSDQCLSWENTRGLRTLLIWTRESIVWIRVPHQWCRMMVIPPSKGQFLHTSDLTTDPCQYYSSTAGVDTSANVMMWSGMWLEGGQKYVGTFLLTEVSLHPALSMRDYGLTCTRYDSATSTSILCSCLVYIRCRRVVGHNDQKDPWI